MTVATQPLSGLPSVPIVRRSHSAADPRQSRELLEEMCGTRLTDFAMADTDQADFQVTSVSAGSLRAERTRCAVDLSATVPPLAWLVVYRMVSGALQVSGGDRLPLRRAGKGEAVLHPANTAVRLDARRHNAAAVGLPWSVITEVAEQSFPVPAAELRFLSLGPRTPALNQQWSRVLRLVHDDLMSAEPAAAHPLVQQQLLKVTASAVLTVFPNTSMTVTYVGGPGSVAARVVRRAVLFMEEHAGEPLTLGGIAEAAGTGARALQYAFRRDFDLTPMAYLTRIRLARAHVDLQTADPAAETVVGVARRWGFADASHFSRAYRRTYGVPPRETLQG